MSSAENEQIKSYEVNAAAHVKGIKNEDVVKYYSSWSEKYEQVNLSFKNSSYDI